MRKPRRGCSGRNACQAIFSTPLKAETKLIGGVPATSDWTFLVSLRHASVQSSPRETKTSNPGRYLTLYRSAPLFFFTKNIATYGAFTRGNSAFQFYSLIGRLPPGLEVGEGQAASQGSQNLRVMLGPVTPYLKVREPANLKG